MCLALGPWLEDGGEENVDNPAACKIKRSISSIGINVEDELDFCFSLATFTIVFFTDIPVSTFILTEFFKGIPKEIEEASYLDGCNFVARYFRIMLPLALPGLATAGTFQFILCWNEFIYAMLLTSSTEIRTIQFGISYFTNEFFSDYVGMFAAVVVSILPSITVFILFQERVITGLTAGSVKG